MWKTTRLAWAAAIQSGGRIAKLLAGVVAFAVASRALSIQSFGDFVVTMAYVLVFSALASFGVDNIMIRDLSETESEPGKHARFVRSSFGAKLLLAAVAMGACIGGAIILQFPGRVVMQIALFSPYILVTTLGSNGGLGSILQARRQSGSIALASTASAVLIVVLSVLAASLGAGVSAFLGVYTVAGVVDCVVCALRSRRLVALRPGWTTSIVTYLLKESWPLGVAAAFVLVYVRVDTILLEKLTDARQVALYGVAYKFFDLTTTVSATLMLVIFPALVRAYEQGRHEIRSFYTVAFTGMLALALPATWIVVLLRRPLIALIVGPKFAPAQAAVPGLMVAVVLMFPASVASYMLVVARRQRWSLALSLLGCAVNIGLNLWLIPRAGSAGYVVTAWTTAATEAFVIVYNLVVVGITVRLLPSFWPMLKVLAAALALGFGLVPGVSVYLGLPVGLVVYSVLLLVLGVVRPSFAPQLRIRSSLPRDANVSSAITQTVHGSASALDDRPNVEACADLQGGT